MYEFGIRNKKTYQTNEIHANTFAEACKKLGWNARDCRCIWRSLAVKED